jgi:hypothetical protein
MRIAKVILTLLLLTTAECPVDQSSYTLKDGTQCGMAGDATSAGGKELNNLKNRWNTPDASKIDADVSLAAMLVPGDDVDRFDSKMGATITGYVIDVKIGGKETCNCEATDPIDKDTHIELALASGAAETERVIVEVTPRLRKQKGDAWATDNLSTAFKGKWVQVTGWLAFDTMHIHEALNTNPNGAHNWRATCWEIHPVTDIHVVDAPPAAENTLHPAMLKSLQAIHVKAFGRNEANKTRIQDRNKELLSKFDDKDREDERP